MKEERDLQIIKNPDGHGTICYKIALPSKWINSMGIPNKVKAQFNDNKIIICKEESGMKKIKESLDFYEFDDFVRKFEKEIMEIEGVVKITTSDLDEEIPYSGGVLRREYWGLGKRGGVKIKKDLLYSRTTDDIFNIYEYKY